jgi:glycosyltransferase involved in cell wall biosynthesis
MSAPELSIAMPCYQQAPFLEEAVCSVLDQQGVTVELIVADPGSTDGSRELLLRLRERYGARLVLRFAADAGQSDAVNLALVMARGRLLGWLNSDDRLRPGALRAVRDALPAGAEAAWSYGGAGMIDASGRPISALIVRYKAWRARRFSTLRLLTENFIPQMAVFWTRALWEQVGCLDTAKDLDMDYDLWLRFARRCAPIVLPQELADFRVHSAAKGSTRTAEQLAAANATARSHARELGWRGRLAVGVHRVLSWRTRAAYWLLKP